MNLHGFQGFESLPLRHFVRRSASLVASRTIQPRIGERRPPLAGSNPFLAESNPFSADLLVLLENLDRGVGQEADAILHRLVISRRQFLEHIGEDLLVHI